MGRRPVDSEREGNGRADMVNRKPGFIGFVIAAVVILALFAGSFNPALATIVRTLAINQSYVIVNLDALDQAATHYFYKPTTGWSALRYHKDLGYFELSTDEGSTWNRITTEDIDSGTTDHTLLSNIGVNTHPAVDTHLADTADPHSTVSDADPPTLTEAFSGAHVFDYLEFFNGTIFETIDVDIVEAAGTVYLELQAEGGGDLTLNFSDGHHFFDATDPVASVALTVGVSDSSPAHNYVYILQSNDTLTATTAGWPSAEHAPIAIVVCQTAASVATDEPYKVHLWTDHIKDTNDQGHVSHLGKWIRQQHANWISSVAPTLTITVVGGSDTVIFTSEAGVVQQLHEHAFPAFTGTPKLYVFNEPGTAYNVITDINELTQDSEGNAFTDNTYFTITIWGVVSEDADQCKLYLNLPSGTYGNETSAMADASNYTNTSIPFAFRGVGFLIIQYTLKYATADSGTFTLVSDGDVDLRGQPPGTMTGGGAGGGDMLKAIYDAGDDGVIDLAASHADLARATGDTYTGLHDAGAATLELPNAEGNGTLGNAGEVHIDLAEDALAVHFGAGGEIAGEAQISALRHISFTFDPGTWYSNDTQIYLFKIGDDAPSGITIVEWSVSCNVDPDVEMTLDFKRATAWIGLTGATVMDVMDTTNGAASEDTNANINAGAVVANGNYVYLEFGADPEGTCLQFSGDIWFYAEED